MPVLINFKICDNAEECSGIEACPTGAIYWDSENNTIAIDNSKCNNCALCKDSCPVEAIHFVPQEEYDRVKKEIDEDPRTLADLMVDRYGAQPIHAMFIMDQQDFDNIVLQSPKIIAVEFFDDDSIMCLLPSIPFKDLFKGIDLNYKKTQITDKTLLERYNVKKLPSLLFFKNGKFLGKIQGYYSSERKSELIDEINDIIQAQ